MDYAQPMNYLIVINNNQLKIVSDGKKSIMDLHSNKMMNQMQDMLTACMVGDLSNMSPGYALEYFEDAHYYLIQNQARQQSNTGIYQPDSKFI